MDNHSKLIAKAKPSAHADSEIGMMLVYLLGFSFFLMIAYLGFRDKEDENKFLLDLPSRQIQKIEFVSSPKSKSVVITDPESIKRISYAISGYYVSKRGDRQLDPQSELYITAADGKKFLIYLLIDRKNQEALIMQSYPPRGGSHASKELFRALINTDYKSPHP